MSILPHLLIVVFSTSLFLFTGLSSAQPVSAATASSHVGQHIITGPTYPGTDVPDAVMQHLLQDRHGITRSGHLPMKPKAGSEVTVNDQLGKMLLDGSSKVSPYSFGGKTYFIAPLELIPGSHRSWWKPYLTNPAGIHTSTEIQPFVVAKVNEHNLETGEGYGYEVMAYRTTATEDDKKAFLNSFDRVGSPLWSWEQLMEEGKGGIFHPHRI